MPSILVTGGTGFIGRFLSQKLLKEGYSLILPTRSSRASEHPQKHHVIWDPNSPSSLPNLSGLRAVVNLAGEPLASGRWTAAKKKEILESRRKVTAAIVEALKRASPRPQVLVSASAIGYYGPHGDEPLSEQSPPGNDFLAGICRQWEEEACKAEDLGVRVALLRIGIVLGKEGGALSRMLLPFKLGLGGPLGSGRQWMSWIHIEDVAELILRCIQNQEAEGPLNATSPQPATHRDFCKTLARVLRRPCLMNVPEFALRVLLGEMSQVVLTGQRVMPEKVQKIGYKFRYPALEESLRAILC